MSKQERRIISIIPANGWFAYYRDSKTHEGKETLSRCKVLCLALFDDSTIAFMDADGSGWVDVAADTSNFAHVAYEGNDA